MAETVISALFLFNNRFERNVPVLEDLYRDRFSRRKYIMPFATQDDPDIIPVVEAGWYFSGHLAQAAPRFIEPDVTHYVVISDDLFVNPTLDEHNIVEQLRLDDRTGWIKSLAGLDALRHSWEWSADAAFEAQRMTITDLFAQLPPAAEAQAKFERMGFEFGGTMPASIRQMQYTFWQLPRRSRAIWLKSLAMLGRPSPYPFLSGYGDFLVIPAAAIKEFARLCGLLGAMNIFAEVAVPTAVALACENVVTELKLGENYRDLETRSRSRGRYKGIEFAGDEMNAFGDARDWKVERLVGEFPNDWLYAHPIKFSQWR